MKDVKHFLRFSDLTREELDSLFKLTSEIKKKYKAFERHNTLEDRTLVMVFEKSSTRTRLSFELGKIGRAHV